MKVLLTGALALGLVLGSAAFGQPDTGGLKVAEKAPKKAEKAKVKGGDDKGKKSDVKKSPKQEKAKAPKKKAA